MDSFLVYPENAKHIYTHSWHEKHGCINLNDRFFSSFFYLLLFLFTSISKAIFMFLCKRCKKHVFQVLLCTQTGEHTCRQNVAVCGFANLHISAWVMLFLSQLFFSPFYKLDLSLCAIILKYMRDCVLRETAQTWFWSP